MLIIMLLLPFFATFSKPRKKEKIPASVRVQVTYEKKNRESYRQDILKVLENYLMQSECFEKILTDEEEEADLILEARILELNMTRDYGTSLGELSSEYGDPEAKTRLVISCSLRMQIFVLVPGSKEALYASRIEVDESRKKMYLAEDTERYAWRSLLSGIEREAEKQICGKKEKILKALLKK